MSPISSVRSLSWRRALVALAVGALAACERGGADLPVPTYGTATCSTCGGVIGDEHFAAQYRLADGTMRSFDDPACLFESLRAEPSAPTVVRFLDYQRDVWIAPSAVWFARTPATASHGSGWAAYSSFGAAQEAVTAAGSGEVLSFDQAKEQLRRKTS